MAGGEDNPDLINLCSDWIQREAHVQIDVVPRGRDGIFGQFPIIIEAAQKTTPLGICL